MSELWWFYMPGLQMNRNPDTSKNCLNLIGVKKKAFQHGAGVLSHRKNTISVFHSVLINQMMHFCMYAEVGLSGNINGLAKIP